MSPSREPADPDRTARRLEPARAFPNYRYVPGLNVHPRKNPVGHGGDACDVVIWPADGRWESSEEHRFAIDLFNHAYWWEAHEAWESLWHLAPKGSPERIALQALIQAAAALLKRHIGHEPAAKKLLGDALMGFETAAGHALVRGAKCLALDLVDVATRLDRYFGDSSTPYPRLELE